MINGAVFILLLEAILIGGYNMYIYQRVLELNYRLKRTLLYCCAKRIQNSNWPMDRKLISDSEQLMEVGTRLVNRRFLVNRVLKVLDESELVLDTMKLFLK
ncbi:MAG: hypothetical protein Q4D02_06985 [Clostridia bacterium]|nr:hypothetical protein [Clostridia bacterium]